MKIYLFLAIPQNIAHLLLTLRIQTLCPPKKIFPKPHKIILNPFYFKYFLCKISQR